MIYCGKWRTIPVLGQPPSVRAEKDLDNSDLVDI